MTPGLVLALAATATPMGMAATIVGSLALIGAIAVAVVIVRSSATRTTIELWKGEADAQKARADRLEGEIDNLREEFTAYKSETHRRLESLEIERAAFAELASGKRETEALLRLVSEQHTEVMRAVKDIKEAIRGDSH